MRGVAALPDTSAATPPTIATLRAGDDVAAVFACTRKERLMSRAGTPYLALELRDRTGAMPGDLVKVEGRVERFREELQLDLRAIVRAAEDEADPAAFLPVAYRDLDELDGFLEHLAGEVHDPGYRGLLELLLGDGPLRAAWRRAPCSRGGHHSYLGGLLEHTVAVGTLALEAGQLHPKLNTDLLICAALVHDVGKTQEFTFGAEIGLSEAGRMLGHVELGLRLLDGRAGRVRAMDAGRRLALGHCVLTHHGPEAAPNRRFGSPEALALYRLNALDASIKGALEHGLGLDG
jgi:3'-5' exoribonuclease